MEIKQNGKNLQILQVQDLHLDQTLDCGQCFRFVRQDDGSYIGVALGQVLHVALKDDVLTLYNTSAGEFNAKWLHYFDFTRDYAALKSRMATHPVLSKAASFAPGIRILNQDGWEALCSFIISQNNHIARIKGIVARLCEQFGAPLGDGHYAFPTPQALAGCTVADLSPLRAGFRAKYILDAAQKINSGEVDLALVRTLPTAQAQAELCKIVGVGPKVAACALLFGFGKAECFPLDVWIKRAMAQLLPQGLPAEFASEAGLVQQYLFHYVRLEPTALPAQDLQAAF